MTGNDLEQHEQLALGGVIRLIIRSDGDFSEAEEETVNELGERYFGGAGAIWRVISASAQAFASDDAIREGIGKVERPEARELILAVANAVAAGDELTEDERGLIAWLEQTFA